MGRRKAPIDPNLLETSTMDKQTALDNMKESVVEIFMTAQQPDAVLRAESIKLRDVQIGCCYNAPRMVGEPESIDHKAEAAFLKLIFKMVNIVIKAKRKEPTADRVQRFLAVFLQYIQTKDEEAKSRARKKRRELLNTTTPTQPSATQPSQEDDADVDMEQAEAETTADKNESASQEDEDDEEDDHEDQAYETITSRFVERLLKYLFQGFSDARATVRVRCCQIIALCISSMGELDEDLYQELKRHLFEGHIDREASVRAQAVTALCRLQSDTEVDPLDGQTIHEKLMWSVRHDPSSEVRRLILFNIDVTSEAIPYIVKSIRDPDDTNRRVVYLKTLSNLEDFRLLSFEERREVLKWGLNDRNELVRKAATRMFAENWIKHAGRNLIEFLERLEATKPQMSELIEKLFKEFFKIRSDVFNESVLDDEFWKNLSGESALLAKMMIEYLQNEDEEDERLDKILPSVTAHVMNLENYYNLYQQYNNAEDNAFNYEYIVVQMLDIALCLDYADEVGRRKMFDLLRDILRAYEVVDSHLERILKVFRRISIDERDFTRSITEIISDIQEEASIPYLDMEDDVATKRAKLDDNSSSSPATETPKSASSPGADTPKSASNTEQVADSQDVPNADLDKLVAKLRCLSICRRMLENSYEPLTDNSILYGLLNDLVVPAVQDGDALLRQEGLHCLGLCCTLDKGLAQHNVGLFINCIRNGHEVLVKIAVRTLGDILLMYGVDAMSEHLPNTHDIRNVFEFGLDHDNTEIQSLTTQSLCKLMLFNRYTDDELLRLMILLYFFPKTDMDEHSNMIHQCLAYFFPAYCFSSLEHQKAVSNITLAALEELCNIYSDLEKDENMTNPKQIAEMLADWNDPRKLTKTQADIRATPEEQDFTAPGKLALKALTIIFIEEEGLLRKTMLTFVTRLYLNEADKSDLIEIRKQIIKINEEKPLKLQPARKALSKIVDTIDSIVDINDELENDEETPQQDQEDAGNEKQNEDENAQQEEEADQDSDNGSSILGSSLDHQIEISDNDDDEEQDPDEEEEEEEMEIKEEKDEDSSISPPPRQPRVVRRRIIKREEGEDDDDDEDEDEESEDTGVASEYDGEDEEPEDTGSSSEDDD